MLTETMTINTARGLLAAARLMALTVATPAPTEQDHAEVAVELRRGRWR